MRRLFRSSIGSLLACSLIWSIHLGAQRGGGAELSSGPYEPVAGWPIHDWARPGYIWGSQSGIFPESSNRVFLASRGELKVPGTPPPNFNGVWAALGLGGATTPLPEFRNCIVIVDSKGKMIESWTQWDHLFEGGRGPHQIYISPYDPEIGRASCRERVYVLV